MSGIIPRRKVSMNVVKGIKAREIIDSRGNPTIEVDLTTDLGTFSAPVPSGASTGAYEACELRDGDMKRYNGKGVLKAIQNVDEVLAPKLMGFNPSHQSEADQLMIDLDGTDNKRNLGANAILAVSLALARAGAAQEKLPLYQHIANLAGNKLLANDGGNNQEVEGGGRRRIFTMPTPSFNVINGGSHAGNQLAFQEYFVIPTGAESFAEAMQIGCEVYHGLKKVIKSKYGGDATLIGDEGGFAPPCDERSGLELIMEALHQTGHHAKCKLGLDVAASEFKVKKKIMSANMDGGEEDKEEDLYNLDFKSKLSFDQQKLKKVLYTGRELMSFYDELIKDFPIITIEDPFDEDDWKHWSLYNQLSNQLDNGENTMKKDKPDKNVNHNSAVDYFDAANLQIVADDLTVTNPTKIKKAIESKAANALLLKLNQIGTLSESIQAVQLAKRNKWGVMTSHRSGETCDDFIADLAVGLCTGQIKSGAPCRSERLAKYNRLLKIEQELAGYSTYAGMNFHNPSWMG